MIYTKPLSTYSQKYTGNDVFHDKGAEILYEIIEILNSKIHCLVQLLPTQCSVKGCHINTACSSVCIHNQDVN